MSLRARESSMCKATTSTGNFTHVFHRDHTSYCSHFFRHHGRFEHTVPNDFFPNSEFEFKEPGGEIIVALYPDGCSPGDVLNVRF